MIGAEVVIGAAILVRDGLRLVLRVVPDAQQGRNEREQEHTHGTKRGVPGGVSIVESCYEERLGLDHNSNPQLSFTNKERRRTNGLCETRVFSKSNPASVMAALVQPSQECMHVLSDGKSNQLTVSVNLRSLIRTPKEEIARARVSLHFKRLLGHSSFRSYASDADKDERRVSLTVNMQPVAE